MSEFINEFGKVARLFCEQGIYSEEKVKGDLSRVENQVIKFGEKNETNASAVAEKVVPEIFLQRAFSLYEDAPVVTASDANVFDDQNNRIDSVIFINDENVVEFHVMIDNSGISDVPCAKVDLDQLFKDSGRPVYPQTIIISEGSYVASPMELALIGLPY